MTSTTARYALLVGGTLVATAAMVLGTIVAAVYTTYRLGGVLVPVSILIMAGTIAAVSWFTVTVTESRIALAAPIFAWLVVIGATSVRTTEGDLVIVNNWVGLGTILIGATTATVCVVMLASAPRRPTRELAPAPSTVSSTLG